MKFIADLHIHSRFSRATARNLDFENLYIAARIKGITVVGTGDFTHPGWFSEIREKLVPAESGLFKLKDDLKADCQKQIPFKDDSPVRFMLSSEISNIYKKSGKTRKTHNLVFLPDLESAARFNARLDKIGNIHSDGRPILGLDAKNLLDIVLETSKEGFLVPAHIWTPWFSLFGSKSGFDAIEECFEDLTPHVFAFETGLSSDPPMNWRVGNLDGRTIISNSDAHSPANLGREANLFDADLSYGAIKAALETGDPEKFLGTLEFYPQEGKYHHDGHRKCDVNLHPAQSIQHHDICPVCGHPMTLGVLHRVEELATRSEGDKPDKTHPFYSIIPLAEIMTEITGTGVKSKKTDQLYQSAIERLGPELEILHRISIDEIDQAGIPLLGEAISRMREGRIHIAAGYDGEYGRITVFSPGEKDVLIGQKSLFYDSFSKNHDHIKNFPQQAKLNFDKDNAAAKRAQTRIEIKSVSPAAENLNEEQKKAVTYGDGPVIIVAGPGTGKTKTLTCRIAYLIKHRRTDPGSMLAVTFTNKAAKEMTDRLGVLLGSDSHLPLAATFHAFCFKLLKECDPTANFSIIDDIDRIAVIKDAVRLSGIKEKDINTKPEVLCEAIVSAKQQILSPSDDLATVCGDLTPAIFSSIYASYQDLLKVQHLLDYEDLIFNTVKYLENDPEIFAFYRNKYRFLFVDEYQDLNFGQYRIIKAIAKADGNIFVIGDPDQSIYGFRGSDVSYFKRFLADFPSASQFSLTRNYRSAETILNASHQVICKHSLNLPSSRVYSGIAGLDAIHILETQTEKSEAVAIGKIIEKMVGGTGFHFDDFNKNRSPLPMPEDFRPFSDFAVLYRTNAQADVFAETFLKAGIPFQTTNKETAFCRKKIMTLIALLKLMEGCGAYSDLEKIGSAFEIQVSPKDIQALKSWGLQNKYPVSGLMAEAKRNPLEAVSDAGRKGLGDIFEKIDAFARQTAGWGLEKKLTHLAKQIDGPNSSSPGPAERDALDYILSAAQPFDEDIAGFFEMIALQTDHDIYDANSQKVALMTLHAAKGLEFPIVFIAGCENGWIPFLRKGKPCDVDEERRLFYVAMTRAKEQLFLTSARKRQIFGKIETRELSPFVADIETRLLKHDHSGAQVKKQGQVQLKLFS